MDDENPAETPAPTVRRKNAKRQYPEPNGEPPAPGEAASTPPRPDMRPDMRASADSRAAADKRAAEILENNPSFGTETDKYHLDVGVEPDGWKYGWKRRTTLGLEDPSYQNQLLRAGWTAVPARRHPELVAAGGHTEIIEIDGLVLMERPLVIEERARMFEKRKAMEQVRGKEAQLYQSPPGTFPRSENPAATRITKDFANIPIP